ncbi:hypothetical protein HYZ98_01170 [Candidatus Peregrinibacteria bacterium]|nr:hypothetical protein [Candidatus Peregrinibacteria bacterium]
MNAITLPTGRPVPPSFGEIVAEATMHLPPMTRPQDTAFLRAMTEVTIDGFWQLFIAKCAPEAIAAFHAAEDKAFAEETADAVPLVEWFETHANFGIDAAADTKATEVMQELRGKLPVIFENEYPLFTPDDALAA